MSNLDSIIPDDIKHFYVSSSNLKNFKLSDLSFNNLEDRVPVLFNQFNVPNHFELKSWKVYPTLDPDFNDNSIVFYNFINNDFLADDSTRNFISLYFDFFNSSSYRDFLLSVTKKTIKRDYLTYIFFVFVKKSS